MVASVYMTAKCYQDAEHYLDTSWHQTLRLTNQDIKLKLQSRILANRIDLYEGLEKWDKVEEALEIKKSH